MSFERPTGLASEGEPKAVPGTEETKAGTREDFDASEHIVEALSSENSGLFQKMSEGGKKLAGQAYEGLYKIPGVNMVVGKMEIAYNQFWMDRHEGKAVGFKNKMDGFDLRIGALDRSKKEIESAVESLRQQNIPGVESLQVKLRDIDRQKMGLLNDKDKTQSKFEARENKMKLYANSRDLVADKLIGRYNEKLEPMEKELENLQTCRDQVDLLVAVTEARHKGQSAKLRDIEKRKTQIEEALRGAGIPEGQIRKLEAVRALDDILTHGRESMRAEMDNLARRKQEINKKIAKVDGRANPYRDKREEFVRVKEGRPIKMDVATRKRGAEFKGDEETGAHTRTEDAAGGYYAAEASHAGRKTETAEAEEDRERLATTSYIAGWNAYLKEEYGEEASKEMVDLKDFLRATKLSGDHKLDFSDFKNILAKYYKFRKIPSDRFNKNIDRFFGEKLKVEK